MRTAMQAASESGGLTVNAYRGDCSVLLAFDLDRKQTQGLAGFAIQAIPPKGKPYWLWNRLSFEQDVTSGTKPEQREWTPSNEAPFQKFRWVDFVWGDAPGDYAYRCSAMYFADGGKLDPGPTAELTLPLGPIVEGPLRLGFTRGFLSSQAYTKKFKNAAIRPKGKALLFDTAPFQSQYRWLGYSARELVFDFLQECIDDASVTVDVFAYDLDEPDFVRGLTGLGNRLRIILDNSKDHAKKTAPEQAGKDLLGKSAGNANVHEGKFRRFSHDKVIIAKKGGTPTRVLTGSANFSVRGLYVQANSVLVLDDPHAAQLYEEAFQESWDDMPHFAASKVAAGWFPIDPGSLPGSSVSFAPHASAEVSLKEVGDEIDRANRSVLYAVMQMRGGGSVMSSLSRLRKRSDVFSYGVTQSPDNLMLYKPGDPHGMLVPFAYLGEKIPPPFRKEWSGGMGQVVHHKFVVVDFNDSDPVVFAGSSNLSKGGEEQNGDNLLAIRDRGVATAYTVEALRLVDHYHFRAAMKTATKAQPLTLQASGAPKSWWEPYYDPNSIKYFDRTLFVNPKP